MGLSVRIFGLSSWSILVPQALEGVAAVGLLYATVRRTTGSPAAGLLAGATMALTPVAVLMFRFNNPDAMLVLLLVGSAYATLRAVEAGPHPAERAPGPLARPRRGAGRPGLPGQDAAGVPGAARAGRWCTRCSPASPGAASILHLLGGVRPALVARCRLVDRDRDGCGRRPRRPYIGGSQHNSILELTLGYNGFGRLDGSETGSVGGGNTTGGGSGARPGCSGCSAPRSAPRSPGCCRRPWSSASPALWFARGRRTSRSAPG